MTSESLSVDVHVEEEVARLLSDGSSSVSSKSCSLEDSLPCVLGCFDGLLDEVVGCNRVLEISVSICAALALNSAIEFPLGGRLNFLVVGANFLPRCVAGTGEADVVVVLPGLAADPDFNTDPELSQGIGFTLISRSVTGFPYVEFFKVDPFENCPLTFDACFDSCLAGTGIP